MYMEYEFNYTNYDNVYDIGGYTLKCSLYVC